MDLQRFEQLSAYLDGELPPHEKQQVEEWLDTDPQLRKAYEDLRRLQVPSDAPASDAGLSNRVLGRIEARRRLLGGSFAATAVALAATGLWWRPEIEGPTERTLAVQTLEVAARSYLIEEKTSEDPYALLLSREEPVLLTAR